MRGRWGEITLRRLVELAGMSEHCDFTEQMHLALEDGALRPDMVVHMPETRDLVVDVKTPLDAYLEAIEANTTRKPARARSSEHAQQVGERVRAARPPRATGRSSSTAPSSPCCSCRVISSCGRARGAPGSAGERAQAERHHRYAFDADRAAEDGGLRLAAVGGGARTRR